MSIPTQKIPDEQTGESAPDFEITLTDLAPVRQENANNGSGSTSMSSKPRRGRRRSSTTSEITEAASAVSYEFSDSLFFDELASVVDLDGDDDADITSTEKGCGKSQNANEDILDKDIAIDEYVVPVGGGEAGCRPFAGRRHSGLARNISLLSLKSVLEHEALSDDENVDSSKLVLRRLEQRVVQKHIKTGRLRSVVSYDDVGTSRNADGAAGHRRVRTSLSFGSNMSQISPSNAALDQQQGLQRNNSFRSLHAGAKSAASAGRKLLGL